MKAELLIFINLFLICNAQLQLKQKQAKQVASNYKSCVPVKPGENMDYFNALINSWNIVKMYDAPVQQQHALQPLVFVKDEQTGDVNIFDDVPGNRLLVKLISSLHFNYILRNWGDKNSRNHVCVW